MAKEEERQTDRRIKYFNDGLKESSSLQLIKGNARSSEWNMYEAADCQPFSSSDGPQKKSCFRNVRIAQAYWWVFYPFKDNGG